MKRASVHARQSDTKCPVCSGVTYILSLNGEDLLPCPMCDGVVAGPARACPRCAGSGYLVDAAPIEDAIPCPDCDEGAQLTEQPVNPARLPEPWPPLEGLPF